MCPISPLHIKRFLAANTDLCVVIISWSAVHDFKNLYLFLSSDTSSMVVLSLSLLLRNYWYVIMTSFANSLLLMWFVYRCYVFSRLLQLCWIAASFRTFHGLSHHGTWARGGRLVVISSTVCIVIPCEAEGYGVGTFRSVRPSQSVCPTLGGVHCVMFAATPITAQLWFIHFWKAQVI